MHVSPPCRPSESGNGHADHSPPPETRPGQGAFAPRGDGTCAGSDEEVLDEGAVGRRVNLAKQKQREYEEWKAGIVQSGALKGSAGANQPPLQQAKLAFPDKKPGARPASQPALAREGGLDVAV